MELMGKLWQIEDLVNEVIKDRAYFETSDGGITISGGEPTMQPEFGSAFLKALREKGIHTALDTCGQCSRESLDHMLPYAAMVLFDLKLIDPVKHKQFTGHDNHKILDNLKYMAEYIRSHVYPSELWIRTPIIPNATADFDNIYGIGQYIAKNLPGMVRRWELCAFNNLCRDKYHRLDQQWDFQNENLLTKEFFDELTDTAKHSGVDADIVFATGSTRLESDETKQEVSRGL